MRISDWSSDVCSSDLPSHRQQLGLDLRQRLRAVSHLLTLGHPVFSYFLRILRQKLQAQAVIIAVDPLNHLFTLRYPITVSPLCNGAIFRYVLSEARASTHLPFQGLKAFFTRLHPSVAKSPHPPPQPTTYP